MTGLAEREQRVQWIDEAVQAGARLAPACAEADISIRSHQRWRRGVSVIADARPRAQRPTPANKLSAAERAAIIDAQTKRVLPVCRRRKLYRDWPMKACIWHRNRVFIVC